MKTRLPREPGLTTETAPLSMEKPFPPIELLEDDGVPMESDWHVHAMALLTGSIDYHFRDRDDFYVAGNMFIYFSHVQARNRDFRGPDFFFVWNTTRKPMREYWVVWEEGRIPNVIIELCSPSTIKEDYGRKKDVYESILKVNDYFCYSPSKKKLDGWRLKNGKYVPLKPDKNGRLWSEELGVWVGPWEGVVARNTMTWLRFFDQDGQLILRGDEAAIQRAEQERQLVELEKQRADRAVAENAELKARLAVLEKKHHANGTNGSSKKKK